MNEPLSAGGVDSARPYFSRSELLSSFDGDLAFVHDIVDIFLMRCPDLTAAIRAAAQSGDLEATGHAAHALKGCASYFDRGNFSDCADQIEQLPARDEWRLPALLRELEQKTSDLSLYLAEEFVGGGRSS